MSENEIKPVLWDVTEAIGFDGSRVEDITPCPDGRFVHVDDYQSAIDRLREDLAEIRSQRDRAELLVEARGTCIDRLTAERDAAVADAGRWRHITEELDRSYGDGYTEPKERCIVLEWQQGPWIRDGSNGGAGRPDTFPGWNSIVDEMMAETRRVLAELDHDDCAEGSA
ncbi:hypothetical protein ATCM_03795 [Stenotrophomonas sp. ATCM1_4]|uniref:hypothetical protein n=1 Tax=Stenotrophomonas sp. ATCM1_4 TaxID=2259330 RepID=UPI001049A580|nr:hypothetical protein [Stenotrophomonas sp. ATCM1_4]TDB26839.1 hypothetical protein ATCM_03795 [Stenotrophomonas sp. ATCM1_4]